MDTPSLSLLALPCPGLAPSAAGRVSALSHLSRGPPVGQHAPDDSPPSFFSFLFFLFSAQPANTGKHAFLFPGPLLFFSRPKVASFFTALFLFLIYPRLAPLHASSFHHPACPLFASPRLGLIENIPVFFFFFCVFPHFRVDLLTASLVGLFYFFL